MHSDRQKKKEMAKASHRSRSARAPAGQRNGHGGEHVERPPIAQSGERAHQHDRCIDCHRSQREVGEGILVPPRFRLARRCPSG